MKALFKNPPRSRISIKAEPWRYVRPPTSSLDWMGADWESPTSLDFRAETMDASREGSYVRIPVERPIHPAHLTDILISLWAAFRDRVTDAGMVVDRDERLGVTFDIDLMPMEVVLSARAKCWPAVPGVTVPKPDVTW